MSLGVQQWSSAAAWRGSPPPARSPRTSTRCWSSSATSCRPTPSIAAACRRASTRTSCSTRDAGRSASCSRASRPTSIAAGGMPLIASMDTAHMTDVGWSPRKRGALDMVYGSRLLIERVLRDRVRALAERHDPRGRHGHRHQRPTTAGAGHRRRSSAAREVDADLVVDALGRGSKVSDWLVAAGQPEVPVITLDAKVTYVSQWYDLPSAEERADTWWWKHMVIMPTENKGDHPKEHEYLSNFFPIEGNRSIACMGSWGLDMPRNDGRVHRRGRAGCRPRSSPPRWQASTPTSEVHLTRSTGNKWRRYDKLPAAPAGIVFIGDSICAFNPFYGQGMSSAALSALLLRGALRVDERSWIPRSSRVPRQPGQGAQGPVGHGDGSRPGLRLRDRHRDGAGVAAQDPRRRSAASMFNADHRRSARGPGRRRTLRPRLQPRRVDRRR